MDDWEKKYWDIRSKGANPLSSHAQVTSNPTSIPRDLNGEIDATSILAARIAANSNGATGIPGMTQPGGSQSCFLKEGHSYYVQINTQGFGTSTPLVKQVGTLQNTTGKSFVVSTKLNAYIVDEMQNSIDLSRLSENPQKMKLLVTVKTAFETFLVEEAAIVYPNNNSNKIIFG